MKTVRALGICMMRAKSVNVLNQASKSPLSAATLNAAVA
jgi:hypothetical protein